MALHFASFHLFHLHTCSLLLSVCVCVCVCDSWSLSNWNENNWLAAPFFAIDSNLNEIELYWHLHWWLYWMFSRLDSLILVPMTLIIVNVRALCVCARLIICFSPISWKRAEQIHWLLLFVWKMNNAGHVCAILVKQKWTFSIKSIQNVPKINDLNARNSSERNTAQRW